MSQQKIKMHEVPFEQRSRYFLNDLEHLCKFYSIQLRGENCYECEGPVLEDFLTGEEAKNVSWSSADVTAELHGKLIHPMGPGSLTLINHDVYHAADLEGEAAVYLKLMREAAYRNG